MVQKIKVIILGRESVGKTSLISRFVYGRLPERNEATIGVAFKNHRITRGTKDLDLNLWDTAGQERFNHFLPLYIHHAKIALICFEFPDVDSIEKYVRMVRNIDPNIVIMLVSTKVDLYGIPLGKKYEMVHPAVEKYAEEENLPLKYTSSKTGQQINEVFDEAVGLLEDQNRLWESYINLNDIEEEPEQPSTRCC